MLDAVIIVFLAFLILLTLHMAIVCVDDALKLIDDIGERIEDWREKRGKGE